MPELAERVADLERENARLRRENARKAVTDENPNVVTFVGGPLAGMMQAFPRTPPPVWRVPVAVTDLVAASVQNQKATYPQALDWVSGEYRIERVSVRSWRKGYFIGVWEGYNG